MLDSRELRGFLARTAVGSLFTGLVTALCFRLHLSFATTGFFYLVVVVLQSLSGNFASSALVSSIAVLSLDYFFVPPLFSLQVTSPLDWVALFSFLTTSLVITRLTTQVRREAMITDSHRRQMDQLYELASRLLSLDPEDALLRRTVELIREEFQIKAVCLYDSTDNDIYSSGSCDRSLIEKTLATHRAQQDSDNGNGLVLRRLRAAGETVGAIGLRGLSDADLNAGPLSALAAAMLERHRVFQQASHSAAAAQAEVFRGAVLDALAHEFKTPLATILAAAGCLRVASVKTETHEQLSELIETEASKLSTLTSRILRTSKLDREEIKPSLQPTNVSDLIAALVDEYSRQCEDRQIRVTSQNCSTPVLADSELLQIAVRQLLENACKYSPRGLPIDVSIEAEKEHAAVRVRSLGRGINKKDKRRIFERFYRGSESNRDVPGSGLGLYFVKTIVCAYGGTVELEDKHDRTEAETVFRITLPLVKSA